MKKSLLFSTLLFILVLLIALSTATFAWFSASNVVNLSSISFTADTDSREGDLSISWDRNVNDSFHLEFASPADNNALIPALIPSVLPELGVTTFEQFASSCITSAQINLESGAVYQIDGEQVAPYLCRSPFDYEQTEFYVYNKNQSVAQNVTLEFRTSGDLADKIRIAVFVDGVFEGILCSDPEGIHYGEITAGEPVSSTPSDTSVLYVRDSVLFTLDALTSVSVSLAVWFDGVSVGDADISKEAVLSDLVFKGYYVA